MSSKPEHSERIGLQSLEAASVESPETSAKTQMEEEIESLKQSRASLKTMLVLSWLLFFNVLVFQVSGPAGGIAILVIEILLVWVYSTQSGDPVIEEIVEVIRTAGRNAVGPYRKDKEDD